MKRFRLLPAARKEMIEAALFYDERRAGLGYDFLTLIDERIVEIEADPLRFPVVETLEIPPDYRRVLLSKFPYIIVYRITDTEIIGVAVAHTSQAPNYWLGRE